MLPKISESRKITGLVLVLLALIALLVIAVVAVSFFGLGESLFTQFGAFITTLGGAHQAGQAMQDRAQAYSPNYPAQPLYNGYQAPATPTPGVPPRIP